MTKKVNNFDKMTEKIMNFSLEFKIQCMDIIHADGRKFQRVVNYENSKILENGVNPRWSRLC